MTNPGYPIVLTTDCAHVTMPLSNSRNPIFRYTYYPCSLSGPRSARPRSPDPGQSDDLPVSLDRSQVAESLNTEIPQRWRHDTLEFGQGTSQVRQPHVSRGVRLYHQSTRWQTLDNAHELWYPVQPIRPRSRAGSQPWDTIGTGDTVEDVNQPARASQTYRRLKGSGFLSFSMARARTRPQEGAVAKMSCP
jgi:hypothetical protein